MNSKMNECSRQTNRQIDKQTETKTAADSAGGRWMDAGSMSARYDRDVVVTHNLADVL